MRNVLVVVAFVSLLAQGCQPNDVHTEDTEPKVSDTSDSGDAKIAKPGDRALQIASGGKTPIANGEVVVAAPDLSSMPTLIDRIAVCQLGSDGNHYGIMGSGRRGGGVSSGSPAMKRKAESSPRATSSSSRPTAKPKKSKKMASDPMVSGLDDLLAKSSPSPSEASAQPQGAPVKPRERKPSPEKDRAAAEIAVDELREEEKIPAYENWGAKIYLSNDDTMSLSSAQRVIYAVDNFLPLPLSHIRPHELLNYFAFETGAVEPGRDFSVIGDLEEDPKQPGIYSLALAVQGKTISRDSRRNSVITLVIDKSGSMSSDGRMKYLKRGLRKMVGELKTGDMIHLVVFNQNACSALENYVIGRDSADVLERAIESLNPGGSTNLHDGLKTGYEIADRTYQPNYSNRVMLITDALTNTGVTNEQLISIVSKHYDSRKIRLSGIGVGRDFNDSLLDKLTERGKGAYVFLGSEAEVDATFGKRFVSLIETTANNVRFRLHLPPSLRMNVFYGEESSTVKSDVQQIHYFANTSQLFLSDLVAKNGRLNRGDNIKLSIEYENPENNRAKTDEFVFNVSNLERDSYNVKKARLTIAWVDLLAQMAARPRIYGYRSTAGGWNDADGWQRCQEGSVALEQMSEGIADDPEVKRVLGLWERFCSRYDRPRNPVKRDPLAVDPITKQQKRRPVTAKDSWPGAQSGR